MDFSVKLRVSMKVTASHFWSSLFFLFHLPKSKQARLAPSGKIHWDDVGVSPESPRLTQSSTRPSHWKLTLTSAVNFRITAQVTALITPRTHRWGHDINSNDGDVGRDGDRDHDGGGGGGGHSCSGAVDRECSGDGGGGSGPGGRVTAAWGWERGWR